jgi:hypothetical protein
MQIVPRQHGRCKAVARQDSLRLREFFPRPGRPPPPGKPTPRGPRPRPIPRRKASRWTVPARLGCWPDPDRRSRFGAGLRTRVEQRVSRPRLLEPSAVDRLLEREDAVAVRHAVRAGRPFRDDTVAATHQRRAGRDEPEPGPRMSQIRVERIPPLQPWSEWAPSADRFAVPLDPAPCPPGHFTFEGSGLSSPGRRSDGSAERRKRIRPL